MLIAECFLTIQAKGFQSFLVTSVAADSRTIVGTQGCVAFLAARQPHAPVLIMAHRRISARKDKCFPAADGRSKAMRWKASAKMNLGKAGPADPVAWLIANRQGTRVPNQRLQAEKQSASAAPGCTFPSSARAWYHEINYVVKRQNLSLENPRVSSRQRVANAPLAGKMCRPRGAGVPAGFDETQERKPHRRRC